MRALILYSHADKHWYEKLKIHLKSLQNEELIVSWTASSSLPSQKIDNKIKYELEAADLVLPLISSNFMASEFFLDKEFVRAIDRLNSGYTKVLPIILEPCNWNSIHGLSHLHVLPSGSKPISTWKNQDEAFSQIIEAIKVNVSDYKTIPEPNHRELPHIFLKNHGTPQKFVMPQRQKFIKVPIKENFEDHVEYLLSSFDKAIKQDNQNKSKENSEISVRTDHILFELQFLTKNTIQFMNLLEDSELLPTTKLVSTFERKLSEEEISVANVIVPYHEINQVRDTIKQSTSNNSNKHQASIYFVSALESIKLGNLTSLFAKTEKLPSTKSKIWWEVWVRKNTHDKFKIAVNELGIVMSKSHAEFVNRDVYLVQATKSKLKRLINCSDSIAEVRLFNRLSSINYKQNTISATRP